MTDVLNYISWSMRYVWELMNYEICGLSIKAIFIFTWLFSIFIWFLNALIWDYTRDN